MVVFALFGAAIEVGRIITMFFWSVLLEGRERADLVDVAADAVTGMGHLHT